VLPGAQQRFLHHILGAGPITGQPQGVAPQRGGVLVVEHPHRGGLRFFHHQPPANDTKVTTI
jgi:hypothetical protein